MKKNSISIIIGFASTTLIFIAAAQTPSKSPAQSRSPLVNWQTNTRTNLRTNRPPQSFAGALNFKRGLPQSVKGVGMTNETRATYLAGERGPNHREWLKVTTVQDKEGQPQLRTNRAYVELADGIHYREGTEWKETKELIEPAQGGAVARYGPHKAFFADNLNTEGATVLDLPDGRRLTSQFLGLIFADIASGKSKWIAQVQDCRGQIVGSNQVLYAGALGSLADVRYTYRRNGWEQDIILKQRPALPQGFDPNSTVIQAVTEFLSPPQPAKATRTAKVSRGLELAHEDLDWGTVRIGEGKVFDTGRDAERFAISTCNQWLKVDGRDVLLEQVPLTALQKKLEALPEQASTAPTKDAGGKIMAGGFSLPRSRMAKRSTNEMMMAAAAIPAEGLVWDYPVELSGFYANYTLRCDTTYLISGPVNLAGNTTLEAAVIKYAVGGKITIGGVLNCKTGPYNPAIFTAIDDNSVGELVENSTGNPEGYYAGVGTYPSGALVFTYAGNELSHVRIAYAWNAVVCPLPPNYGYYGHYNQMTTVIRHAQILHCKNAAFAVGYWDYDPVTNDPKWYQVTFRNVLLKDIDSFACGYYYLLAAQHVTIDGCDGGLFRTSTQSHLGSANCVNSIFANVTSLGDTSLIYVSGQKNGFYESPQAVFGSSTVADDQPPFSPTGFIDDDGHENFYIVNGQGAYYLREESPFVDKGITTIDPSLKNELARMTTEEPEEFMEDVNSSMTLGPRPIRDTDTLDLGYHYPAIDYVVNGVTVNNCTLNIDQGTVLGYTQPFGHEDARVWGIRLNAGGRLNVNGVPTNRVTFAVVEAVQENPTFFWWVFRGPYITFRGVVLPDVHEPVTVGPFAEARFHHADFPAVPLWWPALQFDVLPYDWIPMQDRVANLELDGCHFRGGYFFYEAGSLLPRTFTMRNTIFERTAIDLSFGWWWDFDGNEMPNEEIEEQFTAANNLFYGCRMLVCPLVGANWRFTDNIFDRVTFVPNTETGGLYNGPVAVNHRNAYVGMTDRLSPTAPTSTDPNLTTLNYLTGALGRFYLPTTAALLVDKGSQPAADAGLYHFTSFTSNAKEGNGTVNIGPHYLALVANKPADADTDGIADFIEDRNGDGTAQANESNWAAANHGFLTIVDPADGASVSGIVRLAVSLADGASSTYSLLAKVDGGILHELASVKDPAISVAEIEIDTRLLPNGMHSISVTTLGESDIVGPTGTSAQQVAESSEIAVNVVNSTRFPAWENMAQLALKVRVETQTSPSDYIIWFFGANYPFAYNPAPIDFRQGTTPDGAFGFSENLANLGYGDGSTDPSLTSITELRSQGGPIATAQAAVNPNIRNDVNFPPVGRWVVTYEEDPVDAVYDWNNQTLTLELISYNLDPLNIWDARWMHDLQLGGWFGCAVMSDPDGSPIVAFPQPGGSAPQTWPLRTASTRAFDDNELLRKYLGRTDVRNVYALAHGPDVKKGLAPLGISPRDIKHRYRFVFLDSCDSAWGYIMMLFGATTTEWALPNDRTQRTLGFLADLGSPGDKGPIPIDFYAGYLRPAAFLGWNVEWPITRHVSVYGLEDPQYDPTTHLPCSQQIYTAMCNWHSQVVFHWTLANKTLVQALRDATDTAYVPGSDPQVFPHIYVGPFVKITRPGGQPEPDRYFDGPRQNLAVYGHGGMKFNWWNHAADEY